MEARQDSDGFMRRLPPHKKTDLPSNYFLPLSTIHYFHHPPSRKLVVTNHHSRIWSKDTMTTTQMQDNSTAKKIRYAVVGLGWFAQSAALPAFANSDNSQLVALVSDDPTKRAEIAKMYGIEDTYTYDRYEELLNSGKIDAVYIALPNHLHCEYTVKAAKAGIHVLCEKPMAVTVEECQQMIDAARENNVKLMIAYRLHLESANMQAVEVVKSGQIGEPRFFNSIFAQQTVGDNIRVKAEAGGGTLEDIGIYCINAARYIFQSEPTAVFATSANNGEERFKEVAEMTSGILRFPGERLATFTCSFGSAKISIFQVVGTIGDLRVEPAYSSQGEIKHTLSIEGDKQERSFEDRDQLAAVFVYFSDCILQDKEPEPSGQEGLIDVKIIRALHNSIETGGFVSLDDLEQREHRPNAAQTIEIKASQQKQELVHAADPGGNS
jgi:predicted dehydrogenase